MAGPSRPFSARLAAGVAERLEARGARAGVNKSRLAERYIDEGLRMDEHPGILFRDGPSGRRAALSGGPDVWQVVQALRANGGGDAAVQKVADWARLTETQIRAAVRYYSEFPDEVDERIRRNLEEADAAEAAWRREQDALA